MAFIIGERSLNVNKLLFYRRQTSPNPRILHMLLYTEQCECYFVETLNSVVFNLQECFIQQLIWLDSNITFCLLSESSNFRSVFLFIWILSMHEWFMCQLEAWAEFTDRIWGFPSVDLSFYGISVSFSRGWLSLSCDSLNLERIRVFSQN